MASETASRARVRSRLIPTLISVPGVIMLLGLGTWQVSRHFERTAENDLRASQLALPAVEVDRVLADPDGFRFRRVHASGTFAHEREIYMYARSKRGNEGYYILTPLLRQGAAPVMINRGWVPNQRKEPSTRPQGQVAGPVTVEGILRTEQRKGLMTPDNDTAGNRWFWFDLPAMATATKLPNLLPVYVEAGAAPNPGGFPIGDQTQEQLPLPHLQYAITWYSLAVALAVIFALWLRRQKP